MYNRKKMVDNHLDTIFYLESLLSHAYQFIGQATDSRKPDTCKDLHWPTKMITLINEDLCSMDTFVVNQCHVRNMSNTIVRHVYQTQYFSSI